MKPKPHVSSSCAVSPRGCPCGFLRQRTRPGEWFDALCHGLQRVTSTGDGQCRRHQRAFLRVSLYRFFRAPTLRWPEESSPYRAILGKRWSSILETCPTQRSCDFSSMASILVSFACSRTSTLVTNSLQ